MALSGSLKSYAQPFIGQVSAVGFDFAPPGWLKCEGQLLSISEYNDLFVLIGTTYGGDGVSTFALPDYRGRTLIGAGTGPGMTPRILGQNVGAETNTMTTATMPAHQHGILASNLPGDTNVPTNNVMAYTGRLDKEYVVASSANTTMFPTQSTGAGTPINTIQPYAAVYYIIAVEGSFPSQN